MNLIYMTMQEMQLFELLATKVATLVFVVFFTIELLVSLQAVVSRETLATPLANDRAHVHLLPFAMLKNLR